MPSAVPSAPSDPSTPPQLGLIGMQERVALLNGTLTIESAPGKGTTVYLQCPARRPEAERT